MQQTATLPEAIPHCAPTHHLLPLQLLKLPQHCLLLLWAHMTCERLVNLALVLDALARLVHDPFDSV